MANIWEVSGAKVEWKRSKMLEGKSEFNEEDHENSNKGP
jgi:hypothetical protein